MAARSPKPVSKAAGGRAPASRRASARSSSPSGSGGKPAPRRRTGASKSGSTPAPARRSSSRGRVPGNVLVWVVCAGLVLAAWWIYPVMRMHYIEQRNLATLQAQFASVQARNETLREQVRRLKTPAGIEQAARESLGLVRQGESAYVVVQEGAKTPTATATESLASPPSSAPAAGDPVTVLLDGLFGFAPK